MILAGDHAGLDERTRFRSEAEAVARIQHANIVQIYEIGEEGGRPYFSPEYVDGGNLTAKIHGEPQPPAEAAHIVQTLVAAMDCAHKAGVVHRDLKPANVLLTHNGTPKITDFGLAKRVQGNSSQTQSGDLSLREGKTEEDDGSYHDSLDNLHAAMQHTSDNIDYRVQLARAEERFALVTVLQEGAAAENAYQEALHVRLKLLDIEPNNLTWQAASLPTLAHCGKEADALKRAGQLCERHSKSMPLLVDVARCRAAYATTASDPTTKQQNVEQAVAALRAAKAACYKDVSLWQTDPGLAPIRDVAAFRSLLDESANR